MGGKSVITVASSAGIVPGMALMVGGEGAVRVKAVDGDRITVTRWRWWHTAVSRIRRSWRDTCERAAVLWCAARGHPLDGEYCRCGERENPDWLDEWEDLES